MTARNEILWWVENTHSQFRNIDHGKYGDFLTTDASKEGWGAVFSTLPDDQGPNSAGGRWTLEEKEQHINILELKAGLMGLNPIDPSLFNNKLPCSPDHPAKMGKIWVPSVC